MEHGWDWGEHFYRRDNWEALLEADIVPPSSTSAPLPGAVWLGRPTYWQALVSEDTQRLPCPLCS